MVSGAVAERKGGVTHCRRINHAGERGTVMDEYAFFVGCETPIPWLKRWDRKRERKAPEPDPQTRLRNIDYMNILEELEFK